MRRARFKASWNEFSYLKRLKEYGCNDWAFNGGIFHMDNRFLREQPIRVLRAVFKDVFVLHTDGGCGAPTEYIAISPKFAPVGERCKIPLYECIIETEDKKVKVTWEVKNEF